MSKTTSKSKRRGRPPKVEKKSFTDPQLVEALLYMEDIMERAMTPFVVMGTVSYQIYKKTDPILEGEKIELGVVNTDLTRFCKDTLKAILPGAVFGDNETYFVHPNGVPVHIHKLENNNKYASNPDYKFFNVTQFRFPNPFDEFYKEFYG